MGKNHEDEINQFFITNENKEEFLGFVKDAVEMSVDFKTGDLFKNELINFKDQKEISEKIYEKIPQNSISFPKVLDEYKNKILDGSTNWSWKGFIGFPDSGNSIAANIGHFMQGLSQQNLCNSKHISPTATFVEIQIINWLRELLGYKVHKKPKSLFEIGGVYAPGGVLSNTIALLVAREKKFKNCIKKGINFDPSKIKMILPTGIGHYSSRAAMGWLGMGTDNVIFVKTNPDFSINQDSLKKEIKDAKARGETIFCVTAYAGDSRSMMIDDFKGLSKITKKEGIWLHADACHGSSLAFSEKLKPAIEGLKYADSVTLDPHKVFWSPYNLSYVLFKDPAGLKSVSGVSDLITNESFSFGQTSPFIGSWGFHSLKLWFTIKHMGLKNIGKYIELRKERAEYLHKKLGTKKSFYRFNNVTINSVIFMYVPDNLKQELLEGNKEVIDKVNLLNKNIREKLFESENYFIHTFKVPDFANVLGCGNEKEWQTLRVMIGNPLTDEKVLDSFLGILEIVAQEEYKKLFENKK
ncbi:hypothetical protein ISS08_02505 [Candidatus Pacearchaeota archaeon]|nr:hypothetical protein [Candidatus Pacearchaeota archaeon]